MVENNYMQPPIFESKQHCQMLVAELFTRVLDLGLHT